MPTITELKSQVMFVLDTNDVSEIKTRLGLSGDPSTKSFWQSALTKLDTAIALISPTETETVSDNSDPVSTGNAPQTINITKLADTAVKPTQTTTNTQANTVQVASDLNSKLEKSADPIQQIKAEVKAKAKAKAEAEKQKLDKKVAELATIATAIAKARIQVDACLETCDTAKAEQLWVDSQLRLEKIESQLAVKANKPILAKIQELTDRSKVEVNRIEAVNGAIAVKLEAKAKTETEKLAAIEREKTAQVSLEVGVDPIFEARIAAEKCRIPQFVSLKKLGYAIKIVGTVKTVNGISFYVGKVWHKQAYLGLLTQDGFLVESEEDQYDSYMVDQLLPALTEMTYPQLLAKQDAREQKRAKQLEDQLEAARKFWERKSK